MKVLTYERMDRTEKYLSKGIKYLGLVMSVIIFGSLIMWTIVHMLTQYPSQFAIIITIAVFMTLILMFGTWWMDKKQSLRLEYKEEE